MRRTLALAGLFLPLPALAQTPAACAPGTATRDLWANNVRARLYNTGALFWRGAGSVYNVPAAPDGEPITPNPIFTAGLWVGGYENGTLRQAATPYGDWEFVPGPLTATGAPPADCTPYDRIYRVTRADLRALETGGPIAADLAEWPWRLGAPVADGDGVPGNYNVLGGDRPDVLGDETHWWVMNAMSPHRTTGSAPFPLEVQVTAFAAASDDPAVDYTTLYRYRLVWRGTRPLTETWLGFWMDPDLGNAADDYIGADTSLDFGFVYNADDFDEGGDGYGQAPPALGVAPLPAGPLGWPGRPRMLFWNSNNSNNGNPRNNSADYYRYMTGRWRDGSPVVACGDGDATTFSDATRTACGANASRPAVSMYPGDPVTRQFWSEFKPTPTATTANAPSDRHFLLSLGPATLQPGEARDVVFAVVWARGADHLDSVTRLREATRTVRATWATTGFRGLPASTLQAPTAAPVPLAPGPDATGLARGVPLVWSAVPGATRYEYTVAREPVEGARTAVSADTMGTPGADTLAGDVYWRVRGQNRAGDGPWSPWRRFRTTGQEQPVGSGDPGFFANFLTVANAAGPLTTDPPQFGAMDPNHRGFPRGGLDPFDQTAGVQQSTNNSRWGLHTADTDATDEGFTYFVGRTLRDGANAGALRGHDYEWRFTGSSVAYSVTTGAVFDVPFELWDVGADAGPADDVRLVPYVEDTAQPGGQPNGRFNLGPDHPTSGGTDDPQTDAVHWMRPANAAPGRAGYDAYVADVTGPKTLAPVGEEILARTVLVSWNGGPAFTGPFTAALPEPGTVFRVVTSRFAAAAASPSAPTDRAGTGAGPVVLYWYGGDVYRGVGVVEVASDSAFAHVVAREPVTADGRHVVRAALEPGRRYWWRVGGAVLTFPIPWSTPWSFVVGADAAAPSYEPPAALAFDGLWPNPVRTRATLRYGLPEAAEVRVEVVDLLGRRVLRATAPGEAGWHTAPLDVSGLAAGLYVVRIESAGAVRSRTVVVAR